MTKPLPEPSELVAGMSHREMLEIMRSNDIFCGHDKFARILIDAQRRALALQSAALAQFIAGDGKERALQREVPNGND